MRRQSDHAVNQQTKVSPFAAWRRRQLGISDTSYDENEVAATLNLARVALETGDFEAATAHAEKILHIAKRGSDLAANAQLILIKMKTRQGMFAGLVDELEALLAKSHKVSSGTQASIGNEIVRICHRSGNLGFGAQRGEELLRDYSDRWPDSEVVELLCQIAACHFFRGDTERAEELVNRALKLAEKCKEPKPFAQSYWQLSMLSIGRGDMTLSLSHTSEAQRWAKLAEMNQILPALNLNAAAILLELPSPDLARIHELAEAAYLELTAQNHPGVAAYACVTLSEVELRRSNFVGAHEHADRGLTELPQEIPGPRASLYIQKAKILARTGDYVQSEAQANIAVEIMRDMEPSKYLATSWGHLARVFVEIGLADRGVYAYEQALQVAGVVREEPEEKAEEESHSFTSNKV